MSSEEKNDLREKVREGYASIAKKGIFSVVEDDGGCSSGGGCCGAISLSPSELAEKIGYSVDEIEKLPDGANMGLSCGNPTAIAELSEGQVVVDLGSGGGFDCFLAGPKVGAAGRVIGVDMTPEMITKARRNLAVYSERTGLKNVEFRLGEIEYLPIADASVDVIISNCVLNLSPDKIQVWREMYRILKPGGKIVISDLALKKELPPSVVASVEALVGCIAGAVLISECKRIAIEVGFTQLSFVEKADYVAAMTNFQDPLYQKIAADLPAGESISDYVVSLDMSGKK